MKYNRPKVHSGHIWAKDAENSDIIQPDQQRIERGWTYEDKISYQEWNWYGNTVSSYINHVERSGIPYYSNTTKYPVTSYFNYEDAELGHIIYQNLSPTYNDPPTRDHRRYSSFELVKGIQNVFIDLPKNNDVIVYYQDLWINAQVNNYPLVSWYDVSLLKNFKYDSNNYFNYSDNFKGFVDDSGSYYGTYLSNKKYIFTVNKDKTVSSMEIKILLKKLIDQGLNITDLENVQSLSNKKTNFKNKILYKENDEYKLYSLRSLKNKDIKINMIYSPNSIDKTKKQKINNRLVGGIKIYNEGKTLYIEV